MFIKEILIKNFRSYTNAKIEVSALNLLVGLNDVGKSNVLKALNLFFNNETELSKPLSFEDDFSCHARTPAKSAREISIQLKFQIPSNYTGDGDVVWSKAWRANEPVKETQLFTSGNEIPERSRIPAWLSRIHYKYVPAIKSQKYFEELLGDLYDTLAITIESALRESTGAFIKDLQGNTTEVSKELERILGFRSEIQVPSNFRILFETLDFKTQKGNSDISLSQRGDGIKVRHIPVLLSFIAEQLRKTSAKGSPPQNTIWGYEEPENNLELKKAFELAGDLYKYSDNLQILLTTHSPAFYSLAQNPKIFEIEDFDEERVTLHYIKEKNGIHEITTVQETESLDSEMGMLPFITPHVQKEIKKSRNLEKRIRELDSENHPTLFVEGKTDKRLLNSAIEMFSPKLNEMLTTGKFQIKTDKGAGTGWVADMLTAHAYSRRAIKAGALMDQDPAGIKASKEIKSNSKVNTSTGNGLLKIFSYDEIPEHLKEISRKGLKVPIAIEEMFPPFAWEHAVQNNWLEERTDLQAILHKKKLPASKSFLDHIEELELNKMYEIYCVNKVANAHKEDFLAYILKLEDTTRQTALQPFEPLVKQLEDFFTSD